MISKSDLLKLVKKEFSTTLKVMRAYPQEKHDFKPHERSQEAVRLMSTFVFEMYLLESFIFGEVLDRNKFKDYKPASTNVVIADFEKSGLQVLSKLEAFSDADLNKTVEFGGRKFLADEFALMMICDQIHHRGQLSVYVRMAGGKVPSIYGPSADDSATNL